MAKFRLSKDNIRPTTATLALVHPVGGETDATVTLVGTLSKQFKDAQAALLTEMGPDKDLNDLPMSDQVALFSKVYANCVVGWNAELEEAIGPYTPETALTLFTDADIDWIGGQVAVFITKTANFFRPTTA